MLACNALAPRPGKKTKRYVEIEESKRATEQRDRAGLLGDLRVEGQVEDGAFSTWKLGADARGHENERCVTH